MPNLYPHPRMARSRLIVLTSLLVALLLGWGWQSWRSQPPLQVVATEAGWQVSHPAGIASWHYQVAAGGCPSAIDVWRPTSGQAITSTQTAFSLNGLVPGEYCVRAQTGAGQWLYTQANWREPLQATGMVASTQAPFWESQSPSYLTLAAVGLSVLVLTAVWRRPHQFRHSH